MQTIARANRVFPEKENGLIVDYIGVFRDLEKALAIYGAATGDDRRRLADPGQGGARRARSTEAVEACAELCERYDVDLDELRAATGFEFIALRDAAVEALLVDDEVREAFLAAARRARKLFKAVLPDPVAAAHAGDRRRDPRARRADPRPRPRRAARHLGRRRRGRRAARPLGRSGGVRDPGGGRGRRPRPADRPRARSTSTRSPPGSPAASGPRRERLAALLRERVVAAAAPQPDAARPRRADRAADRRVQRRQPQHRRVPAPADRALARPLRGGAASRRPRT